MESHQCHSSASMVRQFPYYRMFPEKNLGEWDGTRVTHSAPARLAVKSHRKPLLTTDVVKQDICVSKQLLHTNGLQSQAEFMMSQSRFAEAAQCLSDAKVGLKKLR